MWTSSNAQVITEEQGKALAEELGMQYIETSAKSNTNVDEAFFKPVSYTHLRAHET